jgi:nicotinate-nucleotide adenylyltransferase
MVRRAPERAASPRRLSPFLWRGLRVGLLGGTFNPPHTGHVHASEMAMKYLGLDAVWWLVTPGNPLKRNDLLPPLATRRAACEKIVSNPKIKITALEAEFGTVRSFDSVSALRRDFSRTQFIWLAGTDIAFEMHRWHRWRDLIDIVPMAFIGRPTRHGLVRGNVLRNMPLNHVFPDKGLVAPLDNGTVYWLFGEPLNPASSTAMRADLRRIDEKARM